nr:hypothetical protein [Tanacetum cinerariifolium]
VFVGVCSWGRGEDGRVVEWQKEWGRGFTANIEVEHEDAEPHSEIVPIQRSTMISQAPYRYGFYVDAEEHELRDFNEPPNYKVALLDPESGKCFEAINAKMQSMKSLAFGLSSS